MSIGLFSNGMFIVLEHPLTDIAIIADVVGDIAIDTPVKALFLFA